jgi:hypothetical protein
VLPNDGGGNIAGILDNSTNALSGTLADLGLSHGPLVDAQATDGSGQTAGLTVNSPSQSQALIDAHALGSDDATASNNLIDTGADPQFASGPNAGANVLTTTRTCAATLRASSPTSAPAWRSSRKRR